MTHQEIRKKFTDFFGQKEHVVVPSSSLLPDDPSVLFTTAGMQQFKPYYTGQADPMKDFGSLNAVSIQKCVRTSDIDKVGDESHLTFFEMLGNFSFGYKPGESGSPKGGYFKEEAIRWAYEFITSPDWMNLKIDYVSVFGGEDEVPADEESEKIWKKIALDLEIKKSGRKDNFWGPTGDEGPCGPTTEIYVNSTLRQAQGKPPIEVWNIVFNQYYQQADGKLELLKTPGIDTGMGLERLAMVVQKKKNIFETDLFEPLLKKIPTELPIRTRRIIADHARTAAFLITDGVLPSNKEQGYVLRRFLRRLRVYEEINESKISIYDIFKTIAGKYGEIYQNLVYGQVDRVYTDEVVKFSKTSKGGIKKLKELSVIDAASAFKIYESYGLPYEIIREIGGERAKNLRREDFDAEFKKHQEISRAGLEKKFGGHGLAMDTGELKAGSEEEIKKVTRLHTATHLLHAALRKVLGETVGQAGSDVTPERLRFDFTFLRKLTPEEIKQTEKIVNEAVAKDLPVVKKEMSYEEAVKNGALSFFKLKYPPLVNVYTVGSENTPFSREICGGPHVSHTGEIGKFKITKEESVGTGVRRIRATIE